MDKTSNFTHLKNICNASKHNEIMLMSDDIETNYMFTKLALEVQKTLTIVNSDNFMYLKIYIQDYTPGLIFVDNNFHKIITGHVYDFNIIIESNLNFEGIYTFDKNVFRINTTDSDVSSIGRCNGLENVVSTKTFQDNLNEKITFNGNFSSDYIVLRLIIKSQIFEYKFSHIVMLGDILNDEFMNCEFNVIDFSNTTFEESFMYILYFANYPHHKTFDLIFDHNDDYDLLNLNNKGIKKLIVLNTSSQQHLYNKSLKHKVYTLLNVGLLEKYVLLKPLYKLRNTTVLRKTLNINRKDEIMLLNNLDISSFVEVLHYSNVRVTSTFGTQATGNIMGINRYSDKETSLLKSTYRLSPDTELLNTHINSMSELLIQGDSVCDNVEYGMTRAKTSDIMFNNTHIYCSIKKDIITKLASREDIMYDVDLNPVNIGFIRKTLLDVAYIDDVMVMLDKSPSTINIVPFISINKQMLKQLTGKLDLDSMNIHLNDVIQDLNSKVPHAITVRKVKLMPDTYFTRVDRSVINRYHFIKLVSNSTAS